MWVPQTPSAIPIMKLDRPYHGIQTPVIETTSTTSASSVGRPMLTGFGVPVAGLPTLDLIVSGGHPNDDGGYKLLGAQATEREMT